jgi:hypothetical protein
MNLVKKEEDEQAEFGFSATKLGMEPTIGKPRTDKNSGH